MEEYKDVNYEVNKLAYAADPQYGARLQQIQVRRCPLCFFYGGFSERMEKLIAGELSLRFGGEEALDTMHILSGAETVSGTIGASLSAYRRKMEAGALPLLDSYYIPVICMADSVETGGLSACVQALCTEMDRQGLAGKYRLCYYIFYDYVRMDGQRLKEQLAMLRGRENCGWPLGLFTHCNYYETEEYRYFHAVRALATHIYLQSVEGMEMDCDFTLGYWKLDILKQAVADYLIRCVDAQFERKILREDYKHRIRECIGRIAGVDVESLLECFCQMPVNSARLDEKLRTELFRPVGKAGFGDLLEAMYGSREIFSEFLKENTVYSVGEERMLFFREAPGNWYAMEHDLKPVLEELAQQYEAEAEKYRRQRASLDDIFSFRNPRIGNGRALTERLFRELKDRFWQADAGIYLQERCLELTQALLVYLETEEYRTQMRKIKEDNVRQKNSLSVIRREASMSEDYFLAEAQLKLRPSAGREGIAPEWHEGVFDESFLERIRPLLPGIRAQTQEWAAGRRGALAGDFVQKLRELKRMRKDDLYYAARLKSTQKGGETELLFLSPYAENQARERKDFLSVARENLPGVKICERNWMTEMCLELLAFKELPELSAIYGMDG